MKRIAVGWDSGNSDYTEAVMKAWADKVWSWDIEGISLHGYTIANSWEKKGPSVGFGEERICQGDQGHARRWRTGSPSQSAIMDQYDPDKKVALYVDEWGIWTIPTPGSNPGFLQQQNTLARRGIAALNLNIFMRNADRVKGTNIAQMINVLQAMILTDGPQNGPDADLSRLPACTFPSRTRRSVPVTFDAGSYRLGDIRLPRVRRGRGARPDRAGCGWRSSMSIRTGRGRSRWRSTEKMCVARAGSC